MRVALLAEWHTTMTTANHLAVRRLLESAGVEFIDESGCGLGVRRRTRQRLKKPKLSESQKTGLRADNGGPGDGDPTQP